MAIHTLAALVLSVAACGSSSTVLPNEYIIVYPESTAITLKKPYFHADSIEYGRFQCATRTGVEPLWIIDGQSAASIMSEPGFENVTYNKYQIPQNGTFTLLYIPGFAETNNSVVTCAGIIDGQVVDFSTAANFTVYCNWNCSVYADSETIDFYTDTTFSDNRTTTNSDTDTMPLPTDKEPVYISISPQLMQAVAAVVVLGVLLVVVATVLVVVMSVWAKRRRGMQNGAQGRTRDDVYAGSGASGSRNLLEESITSQDLKTLPGPSK